MDTIKNNVEIDSVSTNPPSSTNVPVNFERPQENIFPGVRQLPQECQSFWGAYTGTNFHTDSPPVRVNMPRYSGNSWKRSSLIFPTRAPRTVQYNAPPAPKETNAQRKQRMKRKMEQKRRASSVARHGFKSKRDCDDLSDSEKKRSKIFEETPINVEKSIENMQPLPNQAKIADSSNSTSLSINPVFCNSKKMPSVFISEKALLNEDFQQKCERLRDEKRVLTNRLSTFEKENKKLKSSEHHNRMMLTKRTTTLASIATQMKAVDESLEDDMAKLTSILERGKKKKAEEDRLCVKFAGDKEKFASDILKFEEEKEIFNNQMADLNKQLKEIESIKKDCSSLSGLVETQKEKIKVQTHENDKLIKEATELKRINETLKSNSSTLYTTHLKNTIEKLQEQIKTRPEEAESNKKEAKALKEENGKLLKNIKEYKDRIERLRKERNEKEDELKKALFNNKNLIKCRDNILSECKVQLETVESLNESCMFHETEENGLRGRVKELESKLAATRAEQIIDIQIQKDMLDMRDNEVDCLTDKLLVTDVELLVQGIVAEISNNEILDSHQNFEKMEMYDMELSSLRQGWTDQIKKTREAVCKLSEAEDKLLHCVCHAWEVTERSSLKTSDRRHSTTGKLTITVNSDE